MYYYCYHDLYRLRPHENRIVQTPYRQVLQSFVCKIFKRFYGRCNFHSGENGNIVFPKTANIDPALCAQTGAQQGIQETRSPDLSRPTFRGTLVVFYRHCHRPPNPVTVISTLFSRVHPLSPY